MLLQPKPFHLQDARIYNQTYFTAYSSIRNNINIPHPSQYKGNHKYPPMKMQETTKKNFNYLALFHKTHIHKTHI